MGSGWVWVEYWLGFGCRWVGPLGLGWGWIWVGFGLSWGKNFDFKDRRISGWVVLDKNNATLALCNTQVFPTGPSSGNSFTALAEP